MNETLSQHVHQAPTTPSLAMLRTLGLVAALSGFLVVLVYQITLPMIEENKRIAIERALFKVVPGAVSRRDFLVSGDSIAALEGQGSTDGTKIYAGYDTEGKLAGIALEAAAQGYQDVIRILYGYEPACQCIRGIERGFVFFGFTVFDIQDRAHHVPHLFFGCVSVAAYRSLHFFGGVLHHGDFPVQHGEHRSRLRPPEFEHLLRVASIHRHFYRTLIRLAPLYHLR